jgi:hypothetical protein
MLSQQIFLPCASFNVHLIKMYFTLRAEDPNQLEVFNHILVFYLLFFVMARQYHWA